MSIVEQEAVNSERNSKYPISKHREQKQPGIKMTNTRNHLPESWGSHLSTFRIANCSICLKTTFKTTTCLMAVISRFRKQLVQIHKPKGLGKNAFHHYTKV